MHIWLLRCSLREIFTECCIHSNTFEGSLGNTLCGHDQTPRSVLISLSTGSGSLIWGLHATVDAEEKKRAEEIVTSRFLSHHEDGV